MALSASSGGIGMSDLKVEYEQTISREEAVARLSQLASAFSGDHDAQFPIGRGTVKLDVPGSLRAELEVEVEDDKVEIEIESPGRCRVATASSWRSPRVTRPWPATRRSGRMAHVGQGTPGALGAGEPCPRPGEARALRVSGVFSAVGS